MRTIAWDTETFPIGKDATHPRMVCSSFAFRLPNGKIQRGLLGNGDFELESTLQEMFESSDRVVGHNVAYDLVVTCETFPRLEPLIWAKLERGEITDTMLREQLLCISTNGRLDFMDMPDGSQIRLEFSLAALAKQHLGVDRSEAKGEDGWRVHYELLDGLQASQYPVDACKYAEDDAEDTLLVCEAQDRISAMGLPNGWRTIRNDGFHTAASFALAIMTMTGCRIDADKFRELQAYYADLLSNENMAKLIKAGILRPSEPAMPYVKQVDKARELGWKEGMDPAPFEAQGIKFKAPKKASVCEGELHGYIEVLCNKHGLEVRRTPTGAVSAGEIVQTELAELDEVMAQFRFYKSLQKMVTTELPRMTWEGQPAETVHANFRTLISTLRTSSFAGDKYPSWNGQNVDPKAKVCVIPREGNVICSCDFSTLELATIGQCNYELFGKSKHRDLILAGGDNHAFLGAQIMAMFDEGFREAVLGLDKQQAYEFFQSFKKSDSPEDRAFWKGGRKLAKPTGLGYPGGLGPEKFIALAKKKPYFVDVVAEAEKFPEDFFEVTNSMLFYAAKLQGLSMDEFEMDDFEWTPMLKGIYLAIRMREVWFSTYEEMRDYFKFITEHCVDPQNPVIGKTASGKDITGYCYDAPTGEHIAGCNYTEVCNGKGMQTPAAVGAKLATFRAVRACRDSTQMSVLLGSLPLLFIHDEILLEFPNDDLAHERAMELKRIMSESMGAVLPDVPVGANPCLMLRWDKDAEPEFDDTGRLIVWQPKAA